MPKIFISLLLFFTLTVAQGQVKISEKDSILFNQMAKDLSTSLGDDFQFIKYEIKEKKVSKKNKQFWVATIKSLHTGKFHISYSVKNKRKRLDNEGFQVKVTKKDKSIFRYMSYYDGCRIHENDYLLIPILLGKHRSDYRFTKNINKYDFNTPSQSEFNILHYKETDAHPVYKDTIPEISYYSPITNDSSSYSSSPRYAYETIVTIDEDGNASGMYCQAVKADSYISVKNDLILKATKQGKFNIEISFVDSSGNITFNKVFPVLIVSKDSSITHIPNYYSSFFEYKTETIQMQEGDFFVLTALYMNIISTEQDKEKYEKEIFETRKSLENRKLTIKKRAFELTNDRSLFDEWVIQ